MVTVAIIDPLYATPENKRLGLYRQHLYSVIRQTYPYFVHITIDDGSIVDVQGELNDCNDPRLRYVRRTRHPSDLITSANALNLGIDLSLSRSCAVFSNSEARDLRAVTYLHSDDLFTRNSVERRLAELTDGFVYTDIATFTNGGQVSYVTKMNPDDTIESLLSKESDLAFNHHTAMWDINFLAYLREFVKRKYGQAGIFDGRLNHMEDRDATFSSLEAALEGGFQVKYVPFVSVLYRDHPLSMKSLDSDTRESCQALIAAKHYKDRTPPQTQEIVWQKLISDLPWSMGTFLPEEIKKILRPLRREVRHFILRNEQFVQELREYLSV